MVRAVITLWVSILRSCAALLRSRQDQAIVQPETVVRWLCPAWVVLTIDTLGEMPLDQRDGAACSCSRRVRVNKENREHYALDQLVRSCG
jgi:hypothetical protein